MRRTERLQFSGLNNFGVCLDNGCTQTKGFRPDQEGLSRLLFLHTPGYGGDISPGDI